MLARAYYLSIEQEFDFPSCSIQKKGLKWCKCKKYRFRHFTLFEGREYIVKRLNCNAGVIENQQNDVQVKCEPNSLKSTDLVVWKKHYIEFNGLTHILFAFHQIQWVLVIIPDEKRNFFRLKLSNRKLYPHPMSCDYKLLFKLMKVNWSILSIRPVHFRNTIKIDWMCERVEYTDKLDLHRPSDNW